MTHALPLPILADAKANPLGMPGSLGPLLHPHPLGYAVIDLETTGTKPDVDRIVSFAIILLDPDGAKTETFHGLVDPECPIPPDATNVHGITDEMVATAGPFRAHADMVRRLIDGRALIAHNADFDIPLLTNELARAGFPYEPISRGCTLDAVRVAYPLAPHGHRLADAAPLLGLAGPDDAHDAYSDATVAAEITASLIRDGVDPVATVLDAAMFYWLRAQVSDQPATSPQVRRLFAIARHNFKLLDEYGERVDRDKLLALAREVNPTIERFEDLDRREIQAVYDLIEVGGAARSECGAVLLERLAERPGKGAQRDGDRVWPELPRWAAVSISSEPDFSGKQ
jgi:DNA polymerase III epsilon subunit-like protein